MTVAPIGIQRRMMELGVVRFGEKGPKGNPRKLDHFRLTSPSYPLLEAAAVEYGGTVREWEGAPNEGTYELHTETDTLPIVIPPVYADSDGAPTYPFSQWYELWSGGGCKRRCDGRTEIISSGPCLCDPDSRECDIVTRVRFILPDLPGIGLWRLNTGGYNAAVELPATLEFLAAQAGQGTYLNAVLRLEQRMSKKDGTTRRYAVPVIDVPDLKVRDMLGPVVTTPPALEQGRASLPAAAAPPLRAEPTHAEDAAFTDDAPDLPDVAEPLDRREPKEDPQALERRGTPGLEALAPPPPEPTVPPVGGDSVRMADIEDRRNIFKLKTDRGVTDARLKELLVQITGQDSTSQIPKALVDVVITSLLAEEAK